ncbi:MAG: preprotein translocase subunit SecG [Alphaproteobacteria bacterium]
MQTILLVILILIALALIGVVLVQRSEGGALGIGGGGPGGMFSARGTANFLTRITAGLAAAFMILSLVLVILEGGNKRGRSVMETEPPKEAVGQFLPEEIDEAPLEPDVPTGAVPPSGTESETAPADGSPPSVPQAN